MTARPPSRARIVRRRLTDVPYAVVVGLVGVNTAVTFLAHPGRQSAALLASPLDYLWIVLYGAGGLMLIGGIAAARVNLEAAGCVAVAGGAVVSAVAFLVVAPGATWNNAALQSAFAAAALIRSYHLARGRVLVLLDTDTRDGLRRKDRPR